jgi:hypothetical protein
LTGFSEHAVPLLKAPDLKSEIISWKLRLFVPDLQEEQEAFAKLLERHPLIEADEKVTFIS